MLKRFLAGLGFALCFFTLASAQTVELREAKNYDPAGSPYLGYLSFWGVTAADKLTLGSDYSARLYVTPGKFPAATTMTWATPLKPTLSTTPYGYLQLTRGSPAGGVPKVKDPVKRIGDVTALPISWDVELTLAAGGEAALLSDTFLYTDDTLKTRAGEIGVFGYIDGAPRAWALGPKTAAIRTGEFTDPTGRVWLARRSATYFMFIPKTGDALKFSGDLKWFSDFPMGAGLVTADMRYPGTGLGIEPGQGAGMARFNTFTAAAP